MLKRGMYMLLPKKLLTLSEAGKNCKTEVIIYVKRMSNCSKENAWVYSKRVCVDTSTRTNGRQIPKIVFNFYLCFFARVRVQ